MTEKKTWHHYYCKGCGDTYESPCEHKEVEIRAGERKQTLKEVLKEIERMLHINEQRGDQYKEEKYTIFNIYGWLEQKLKAME